MRNYTAINVNWPSIKKSVVANWFPLNHQWKIKLEWYLSFNVFLFDQSQLMSIRLIFHFFFRIAAGCKPSCYDRYIYIWACHGWFFVFLSLIVIRSILTKNRILLSWNHLIFCYQTDIWGLGPIPCTEIYLVWTILSNSIKLLNINYRYKVSQLSLLLLVICSQWFSLFSCFVVERFVDPEIA